MNEIAQECARYVTIDPLLIGAFFAGIVSVIGAAFGGLIKLRSIGIDTKLGNVVLNEQTETLEHIEDQVNGKPPKSRKK